MTTRWWGEHQDKRYADNRLQRRMSSPPVRKATCSYAQMSIVQSLREVSFTEPPRMRSHQNQKHCLSKSPPPLKFLTTKREPQLRKLIHSKMPSTEVVHTANGEVVFLRQKGRTSPSQDLYLQLGSVVTAVNKAHQKRKDVPKEGGGGGSLEEEMERASTYVHLSLFLSLHYFFRYGSRGGRSRRTPPNARELWSHTVCPFLGRLPRKRRLRKVGTPSARSANNSRPEQDFFLILSAQGRDNGKGGGGRPKRHLPQNAEFLSDK